jgi:hypothetical protein
MTANAAPSITVDEILSGIIIHKYVLVHSFSFIVRGNFGIKVTTGNHESLNMSPAIYALKEPVLGGQFAMGATLPHGYAELESLLVGPSAMAIDDSVTGLGDGSLLPAAFY